MFVFLVAIGFTSSMLFSALPWEHYVNCFENGMVPDLSSKEKKCIEVSTPQAFGVSEESFSGFSSIDPPLSEITPRKPTKFEILFQYTSGPYALDNLTPIIEVTPSSASSYVQIDSESISITQGQIRRIPVTLTVDNQIQHEKIFLSISFIGEHFQSSSNTVYKSSWIESVTLDITPKDTIEFALGDCTPIELQYTIVGGDVFTMCNSNDTLSIKAFFDAYSNGLVSIDIPRHMLYGLSSTDCNVDNDFMVLLDGEEIHRNIVRTENGNLVSVNFTSGIHEIEVIGFTIIPDPAPIQYCGIVENYDKLYLAPLDQIQRGMNPNQIKCNDDLNRIQKSNGLPACVNLQTKEKLIQRNWAVDFPIKYIIDYEYWAKTYLVHHTMCAHVGVQEKSEKEMQDRRFLNMTDNDLEKIPIIEAMIEYNTRGLYSSDEYPITSTVVSDSVQSQYRQIFDELAESKLGLEHIRIFWYDGKYYDADFSIC